MSELERPEQAATMPDIYAEIAAARAAAHAKHGDLSIEALGAQDPRWLSILVEEVGEVAHALTYDSGATADDLRGELVQLAAVAAAWADTLNTGSGGHSA